MLPDTLSMIKAIHHEKCTAIKGAPILFIDMLNHPEFKNHDLSSLQYMLVGASTVPPSLLMEIKKKIGIKHVMTGIGMTESSAAGLTTRPSDIHDPKLAYGSLGQPFPYCEVKIVDGAGNLAKVNTDGEICMRGYHIMKGYWDDPVKTAETIDKNGWLHTGDIGCMDENGYTFFKSRAKEVIIRGGVNIYPAEIESFLRTHDQIQDVYCFGFPDDRVGEEVCVWVKLKSTADPNVVTQEALTKFCENKIAYFKVPKYIKFVNAFPINQNGKVQKFKMLEQMKNELVCESKPKSSFGN
jgi:fatty-acyl-CoA synthase